MTDVSDLVKRLREAVVDTDYGEGLRLSLEVSDIKDAAAALEAQQEEIRRLRDLLRDARNAALQEATGVTRSYAEDLTSRWPKPDHEDIYYAVSSDIADRIRALANSQADPTPPQPPADPAPT